MMENKMHSKFLIFLILLFAQNTTSFANSLGIYTHRQPFLLEPILEAYTNQTGIKFKTVYAPKGLAERLKSEGNNTDYSPWCECFCYIFSRIRLKFAPFSYSNSLPSLHRKVFNVPSATPTPSFKQTRTF